MCQVRKTESKTNPSSQEPLTFVDICIFIPSCSIRFIDCSLMTHGTPETSSAIHPPLHYSGQAYPPASNHDAMNSLPYLHTGQYTSFRPNLHDTRSTPRLSSDTQHADKKHKSKTHRHHHHDSHHHHGSRHRDRAKDVLQPPTSFGDLLNKARGSKEPSPSPSRKGSVANKYRNGDDNGKGGIGVGDIILPRRPVLPEDVEREGKKVDARERCVNVNFATLSPILSTRDLTRKVREKTT